MTFKRVVGVPWCCVLLLGIVSRHSLSAQTPNPSQQVVADGPVEMTIQLDKLKAAIADPILLRIQVDAPAGTLITFPVVTDTIGPLSVIDTETTRDLPRDGVPGTRRSTATIELESLESGLQKIPPLEVLYRLPNSFADAASSRDGSLKSEPISIQIISVLEASDAPEQFRDIKGTAELPLAEGPRSNQTWLTVAGTFLVGVLVALVVWSKRGRRLPPGPWALAEVDQIETGYKQKTVDVANAYARLSIVLREYLEAEMSFPATSLSSEELVGELSDSDCPDSAKQRLQRFVVQSDELRFSGRPRPGHACDESPFDAVRAIIRETSDVAFQSVRGSS